MKRLTAILLILCTCITAAACGAKVEEKLPDVTAGISSEAETEDVLESETETEKLAESDTEKETETEVEDSPKVYKKQEVLEKGTPYTGRFDGEHIGSVATEKGILNVKLTVEYDEITAVTRYEGSAEEPVYSCTFNYEPAEGKISVYVLEKRLGNTSYVGGYKVIQGKVYLYDGLVHFICLGGQFDIKASDTDTLYFAPVPVRENELTFGEWDVFMESNELFYAIRAFLENDISGFAKFCNVPEEVYESYKGMVISDYKLYSEDFVSKTDPKNVRKYLVLDFEVAESNSEIFNVGKHSLVCDGSGLQLLFTPKEKFEFYTESSEMSFAEVYVRALLGEGMNYILTEGTANGEAARFSISRLSTLYGKYAFTEEEIRDYAKKYLGFDIDAAEIESSRNIYKTEDGEYAIVGRGFGLVRSTVSEKVRDGITVLTVNYWADYSKTVISTTIEYHLEMVDVEFRPVKQEIIYDSGFKTAYYST
ncbi:MAG: hypothetical protein E7623_04845 [Ruminococcaceae bacterium]|nr:hypothetical protein [Oscillospiraceae bacterium]